MRVPIEGAELARGGEDAFMGYLVLRLFSGLVGQEVWQPRRGALSAGASCEGEVAGETMGFASLAGKILIPGGVLGGLRGDRLARRGSILLGGGVGWRMRVCAL